MADVRKPGFKLTRYPTGLLLVVPDQIGCDLNRNVLHRALDNVIQVHGILARRCYGQFLISIAKLRNDG